MCDISRCLFFYQRLLALYRSFYAIVSAVRSGKWWHVVSLHMLSMQGSLGNCQPSQPVISGANGSKCIIVAKLTFHTLPVHDIAFRLICYTLAGDMIN